MKTSDADHTDPDVALMLAFQRGDEEAFVTLYGSYRDRIVNFTRRMLANSAHGEEAAQDVFIKLFKARRTYKPRSRFSTFLFRIATNHCLNIRARMEHRLTDGSKGADMERHATAEPDQAEAVRRGEIRAAVTTALSRLPDKQSAALVLCHYEGLSYRETADVLKLSESAVKSLVFRAREKMMSELQPLMTETSEVSHAM